MSLTRKNLATVDRLGRYVPTSNRQISFLVRVTNEWTAKKSFATGHFCGTILILYIFLHLCRQKIFLLEKQVLNKRFQMIDDGTPRNQRWTKGPRVFITANQLS